MTSPDIILSVNDLEISFPGNPPFTAVSSLSFHIGKGETLAVVGESGSGKSLTALSLIGLLPAKAMVKGRCILKTERGEISLHAIGTADWRKVRGSEVAMVFQEPMSALNPVMKVGQQLRENILAHQQISREKAKELAIHWMKEVQLPHPEKLYDRYPHQLSGGQKQRIMIAMAMCLHPALLIADEPTTALDVTVQKEVLLLMHKLQKQYGTSMIFITHDLALAAEMADQVLVLYKGQTMEYGPAATVLSAPQHPYTKALLACRPAAQEKGRRLPVVADFLGEKDAVIPIAEQPVVTPVKDEPILEVRDLRIWFGDGYNLLGTPTHYFKAVDEVSFDMKRGEVLGLVGESGCGKSTLSRSLMGLIPVRSGQLRFNGVDLAALKPAGWKKVRKDIQMIFQDPFSSLNPRMTVADMLTEPLKVHGIVPPQNALKEAERLLDLVQLPAAALKRYPHQFSGGQRQRLGIARALTLRPQLLICDESVSALDVSVQAQILNLLKDLQAAFQLSYLFISHDLNVVHYISDRVLVMQSGKIVESGTADKILKHPDHPYTQKLVASIP